MQLYGIGLLPNEQITNQIIKFQNENINFFHKPKLSLNGFLPHTSILQCPFNNQKLSQELLNKLYFQLLKTNYTSTYFKDIYYQPNGWYFLGVNKEKWMTDFQQLALKIMKPLIDKNKIKKPSGFNNYSLTEQFNFMNYGYRYINNAFRPHITLGRNKNCHNVNLQIYNKGLKLFNNKQFNYSKLVIYKAGLDGALANILFEKEIK